MARTFDIYDLNSPMVAPPVSFVSPAATTVQDAATDGRSYWQRLADDRLFNGSVVLLVFACVVYLIAVILGATPLGKVTGVDNLALWLGGIATTLVAAGAITAFLVVTVLAVRQ